MKRAREKYIEDSYKVESNYVMNEDFIVFKQRECHKLRVVMKLSKQMCSNLDEVLHKFQAWKDHMVLI